jgi:cysteinyl-tRNA synthetase
MSRLREGAITLRELAAILGLFREPVTQPGAAATDDLADGLMQLIIEIRADSRKKKYFATADKIRDALAALQVTLEDRPDGTGWKRGAP